MQIKKLTMHNFKQYKDEEITFVEGLTGFIGKNGAGKSTIFEAINLALYGKFATNKDLYKNDLASEKDNFSAELEFEDKGKVYNIFRDFRGKTLVAKAEISENGNPVATGVSEVNRYVHRILKMDSKNFENSFFSKQKEVTSLLTLPVKERQFQLRKMLGLSRLDKLEVRVKDFISEIKSELKGKQDELISEDQIELMNKEIKELTKEEEKISKKLNETKDTFKKIEKLYSDIKIKVKELDKIKDEYDHLVNKKEVDESKLKNVQELIQKNQASLEELIKKKKNLDKIICKKAQYIKVSEEVDNLLEQKSLLEKKNGIKKSIKDLDKQKKSKRSELDSKLTAIKKFEGVEKQVTSKNRLLDSAEQSLESLNNLKEEIGSNIKTLSDHLKEKNDRIKNLKRLGKDSPCPECERPLQEQYDVLLEKYQKEVDKLNSKIDSKNAENIKVEGDVKEKKKKISKLRELLKSLDKNVTQKDNLSDRISELKDEIKTIQAQLTKENKSLKELGKIDFNPKLLKSKRVKKKELKKIYDEILGLETTVKRIPELEEEQKNNKSKETTLLEEIRLLKSNIAELKFDRSAYDKVKDQRDKKEEVYNKVKDQISDIKEKLIEVVNSRNSKEDTLNKNERLKKKIETIESEKVTYEKLLAFLKDFKIKITSHELPAISVEASRLFTNLTRGRYLNLMIDQNFNFRVTREEKDVDLETLSGGEKDLASLCLRIAISKRISAFAGRKNMGFLALDEVFGSQDEDRREELLNSLSEISKDFRQIFVISHNQDVQEAFSNKLLIKKSGNFSKISFSTN